MDDANLDNERQQVESYMKQYCLEELLDETVNCILETRPHNPYGELAKLILNKSMAEILEIYISTSFGENGHACVVATVITTLGPFDGCFGLVAPAFESEEDEVLVDFAMQAAKINDQLRGVDPQNLREVDEKLCSIANLDPSLCVAVSIACCRAGAKQRGVPLYYFLAEIADISELRIPVPISTGLVRSSVGHFRKIQNPNTSSTSMGAPDINGLPLFQEVTLTPTSTTTFEEAIEALAAANNTLKKVVAEGVTAAANGGNPLGNPVAGKAASGSRAGSATGTRDEPVPPPVLPALSIYSPERGCMHMHHDSVAEMTDYMFYVLTYAMKNRNNIKLGLDCRANTFRYNPPSTKTDGEQAGVAAVPGEAPELKPEATEENSEEKKTDEAAKPDEEILYRFEYIDDNKASTPSPRVQASPSKASKNAPPPEPTGPVQPPGTKTTAELIDLYIDLWKRFGLVTIEDPFHNADVKGLKEFREKLFTAIHEVERAGKSECPTHLQYALLDGGIGGDPACPIQMVADASISSLEDLEKITTTEEVCFDTVKINLYKLKSVYKALQLCKTARIVQWGIIVSCEEECIETNDTFIADLAVGVGAGQFAAGGFNSGEYMSKYNRILEIMREDSTIRYAGKSFRNLDA